MTFQKLNIPNGQSTLAIFYTNLGPLQSKYNSDCHQPVLKKIRSIAY